MAEALRHAQAHGGAQPRRIHLAAVGVAGENQVHAAGGRARQHGRVVAEQHSGGVGDGALQSQAEVVLTVAEVVHAGDHEARAVALQADVAVAQHLDAVGFEGGGDSVSADAVVVVAEHGVAAQPRPQASQGARHGSDVLAGVGDEVAGERHQVRLQTVRQLDGPLHFFQARVEPVVDVAQLHQAQAGEIGRQPRKMDGLVGDVELVATPSSTLA